MSASHCFVDASGGADGREYGQLYLSPAIRQKWDLELDEFLNNLDVDTLEATCISDSTGTGNKGSANSSSSPRNRGDFWELDSPLQYNTVHAPRADAFPALYDDVIPTHLDKSGLALTAPGSSTPTKPGQHRSVVQNTVAQLQLSAPTTPRALLAPPAVTAMASHVHDTDILPRYNEPPAEAAPAVVALCKSSNASKGPASGTVVNPAVHASCMPLGSTQIASAARGRDAAREDLLQGSDSVVASDADAVSGHEAAMAGRIHATHTQGQTVPLPCATSLTERMAVHQQWLHPNADAPLPPLSAVAPAIVAVHMPLAVAQVTPQPPELPVEQEKPVVKRKAQESRKAGVDNALEQTPIAVPVKRSSFQWDPEISLSVKPDCKRAPEAPAAPWRTVVKIKREEPFGLTAASVMMEIQHITRRTATVPVDPPPATRSGCQTARGHPRRSPEPATSSAALSSDEEDREDEIRADVSKEADSKAEVETAVKHELQEAEYEPPEESSDSEDGDSDYGSPVCRRRKKVLNRCGAKRAAAPAEATGKAVPVRTACSAASPPQRAKEPAQKKRRVIVAPGDGRKYRGVTLKSNGRYEAQLHDHSARGYGIGKGDQVYLGVYHDPVKAAMSYDRAALRLFGPSAVLNFPVENYAIEEEVKLREMMSKRQYVAHIKSRSDADRGKSGYHGVAKRNNDRWQSRITGVACFGTFSTAQAAARAYDLAAIYLDGEDAVLNYPLPEYWDFKTEQLRENLQWEVPSSVLKTPPSKSRRKRPRGKSTKLADEERTQGNDARSAAGSGNEKNT